MLLSLCRFVLSCCCFIVVLLLLTRQQLLSVVIGECFTAWVVILPWDVCSTTGLVGVWWANTFAEISARDECGAGVLVAGASAARIIGVQQAKVFFGRSARSACVAGVKVVHRRIARLSAVKVLTMLVILLEWWCSVRNMMALTSFICRIVLGKLTDFYAALF